ncbi:MAG: DUF2207 domain-containing protein [Bacilli bacterium]|nr:DUF2207 domain-containing protein [Bacilli bacterium]MDD4547474.1 DUF2207 domain-containing protein [Bacilli bacterium]
MNETIKLTYYIITLCWYLVFLLLLLRIYFSNTKPYKTKPNEIINKNNLPTITPAELSMLFYRKLIPEVFTAYIIKLIYKQKIIVSVENGDYLFKINRDNNYEPIKSEQMILDILFGSIGFNQSVKLSEIESYSTSKYSASEFLTNYYVWQRIIQKETLGYKYFEPKRGYRTLIIYKYIAIILILINIIMGYHSILAYCLVIPSLLLNYIFSQTYKRTEDANVEYQKWVLFKQDLESFNELEEELDTDDVFNLLIYGVVLKTTKKMNNLTFDGMDELVVKLNEVVNECVKNARLNGYREIKWK